MIWTHQQIPNHTKIQFVKQTMRASRNVPVTNCSEQIFVLESEMYIFHGGGIMEMHTATLHLAANIKQQIMINRNYWIPVVHLNGVP